MAAAGQAHPCLQEAGALVAIGTGVAIAGEGVGGEDLGTGFDVGVVDGLHQIGVLVGPDHGVRCDAAFDEFGADGAVLDDHAAIDGAFEGAAWTARLPATRCRDGRPAMRSVTSVGRAADQAENASQCRTFDGRCSSPGWLRRRSVPAGCRW